MRVTTIGHLSVTEEEGATPRILYLGYSLLLSPAETELLLANLRAEGGEAPSALALAEIIGSENAEEISVLVNRVNRKALAIGGRKLIVGVSHRGYRMNPYL
ncbi:MAG: hypothetical protein J6B24_02995 [Clostridia bacterium]|nr:hypothetical protein [Clostridia bacterium]